MGLFSQTWAGWAVQSQCASKQVLVGSSNSVWKPLFRQRNQGGGGANRPSEASRGWTTFSSSVLWFFAKLLPPVFACTAERNDANALQRWTVWKRPLLSQHTPDSSYLTPEQLPWKHTFFSHNAKLTENHWSALQCNHMSTCQARSLHVNVRGRWFQDTEQTNSHSCRVLSQWKGVDLGKKSW